MDDIYPKEGAHWQENDPYAHYCDKCFLQADVLPSYCNGKKHLGCGGRILTTFITKEHFATMTEEEKNKEQEESIWIVRRFQQHPYGAPKDYVSPYPVIPNCPKCDSNFVFRLTFLDHLRTICDKGLSARDFDKTYECHRCGHKW